MSDKKPTLELALGMTVLLTGGFLFAVYVGVNGRTPQGTGSRFSLPAASRAVSGYIASAKAVYSAAAEKAENFAGGLLGFSPASSRQAPSAGGETAYAGRGSTAGPEEEDSQAAEDSFNKSSGKNYGGDGSDGAGGGAQSWADTGGSGSSEDAPNGSRPAVQQGSGASGQGAAASVPGGGGNPVFGGAYSSGQRTPPPRMLASLPDGSSLSGRAAAPSVRPASGGSSAWTGGGNVSSSGGFSRSGGGAADLAGSAEGMKAGSGGSYNSSMSAGAASVSGSSSGGSSPAVSAPSSASSSGGSSSGGGSSSSGGSSSEGGSSDAQPAAAASSDSTAGQSGDDSTAGTDSSPAPAADTPDLIKTVVTEKQNGTDEQLVPVTDAAKPPAAGLLKAGGMPTATKEATSDDPADLNSLSADRQAEMNKQILTFLKNVENKYGKMTEIYDTSCETTPEVCKNNGLTSSYLTMTTSGGAALELGVKYSGHRWTMYTINFKKSVSPGASRSTTEQADPEGDPAE